MARPRKTPPSDPLNDLGRKTEILERELLVQRDAIERLKAMGIRRPQPLRASASTGSAAKRRVAR